MERDYSRPALVTHSRKTSDEMREAIAWLTEHGFKGHFYNVPPEVFDEFEGLQIHPGTDGFHLSIHGDISLWGPSLLVELTERQRQLIRDKFGMEPEEVCAELRGKQKAHKASISQPVTKEEKETAFKVTLLGQIRYLWAEVFPWHESGEGVRGWRFHDDIEMGFHEKDSTSLELSISAKAPVIKNLVQELTEALEMNAAEVEKRAGKVIRDSKDSI